VTGRYEQAMVATSSGATRNEKTLVRGQENQKVHFLGKVKEEALLATGFRMIQLRKETKGEGACGTSATAA